MHSFFPIVSWGGRDRTLNTGGLLFILVLSSKAHSKRTSALKEGSGQQGLYV